MIYNFLNITRWFFFGKILHIVVSMNVYNEVKREINFINSAQFLWTAGNNYMSELSVKEIKNKLGVKLPLSKSFKRTSQKNSTNIFKKKRIPTNFDARKIWPDCSTIQMIKDQSVCGCCWAVATASAFSDRMCIASKQKINKEYSSEELLTCCGDCKGGKECDGCNGGYIDEAWNFINYHGIVSGGDYGSDNGCKPYSTKPCTASNNECPYKRSKPCKKKCTNKKYKISYTKDKRFASKDYLIDDDVTEVQMQLIKHGPISACFQVYSDFIHYKKGIYFHVFGKPIGIHAVRVIGWGTENGQDYWLAANSWGTSWGDNGTFKIDQRINGCDFGYFMGSIPRNIK